MSEERKEEEELNQEKEEISKEELKAEDIKRLMDEAKREGQLEAKFFLTMDEWSRPGNSFDDYGRIKILYGQIEKILYDRQYDYPTTNIYSYIIIPKSAYVVLLHESGDDYSGEFIEKIELYIFSGKEGWRHLDL